MSSLWAFPPRQGYCCLIHAPRSVSELGIFGCGIPMILTSNMALGGVARRTEWKVLASRN